MKITKREYTKQTNDLRTMIAVLQADINYYNDHITSPVAMAEADFINAKHDRIWQMEQEIRQLDREWNTRNWTAGDWASHSLVAQNID